LAGGIEIAAARVSLRCDSSRRVTCEVNVAVISNEVSNEIYDNNIIILMLVLYYIDNKLSKRKRKKKRKRIEE